MQIRSESVLLKLLELMTVALKRVEHVGTAVFGAHAAEGDFFFAHFASIFPSSDAFIALFKQLLVCLTKKEPISGRVRRREEKKEELNLVVGATKVTEEEEEEEGNHTELILQKLVDFLALHYSLFPAGMSQLRLDVSPLFVPISNVPLLFTLEETTQISLLSFMHLIVSRNTNLVATLTAKNQNKPLLTLFNAFKETQFPAVREAIEKLLLSLLSACYFFMNITNSGLFLHFLLTCPFPSFFVFLHDVVQDLKSQRIRFISFNHANHLTAPLCYSACLYASLKPSAVNVAPCFFYAVQSMLLSNPCALFSVQELTQMYIAEAEGATSEHALFAGQMNEDMLQALRNLSWYWSGEPTFETQRGVMKLDLSELAKNEEEMPNQVFHTLLWHDLEGKDCDALSETPIGCSLLLLSCARVEGETVRETLLRVVRVKSRNQDELVKSNHQSELISLASLFLLLRFTDQTEAVSQLCATVTPETHIAILMLLVLLGQQSGKWNWVEIWRTYVSTCPDSDILSLVTFTLSDPVSTFWTSPATQPFTSTLLQRLLAVQGKEGDSARRSVVEVLLQHMDQTLVALSLLHTSLFTDEKLAYFRRLIEHANDTTLLASLTSLSVRWVVPLEVSLLRELVKACASSSLYVELLWFMLDCVDSVPASLVPEIPPNLMSLCLTHIQEDPYYQLLKLLLKLLPSFHSPFLHLASSIDASTLLQNFPRFCSLFAICLHSPESHAETLAFLQHIAFLESLVRALSTQTAITDTMASFIHEDIFAAPSAPLQAEIAALCKQSFAAALSTNRLTLLVDLCQRMEEKDRLTSIVMLKAIQGIAKKWNKNEEVAGDFVRELVREMKQYPASVHRIARKQPDLVGRFIKLVLKKGLLDEVSLELLQCLLEAVVSEQVEMEGLSCEQILNLILNHSEYSAVLERIRTDCVCSDDDALRLRWYNFTLEQYSYSVVFLQIVRLLLQQAPRACTPALFTQLLSLYACSLSPSDRVLREIFKELYVLEQYSPEDYGYLFGRFAPTSSVPFAETPSTWVIDMISGLRFRKSCESYPNVEEVQEQMEVEEAEEAASEESEEEMNELYMEGVSSRRNSISQPEPECSFNPAEDCIGVLLRTTFSTLPPSRDDLLVVDPTLFLPLLHYYLHLDAPNAYLYTSHGILGYLITGLASSNLTIRQCSSCLLQRLYEVVSDASFDERKQIELLLRKFQNSITNPAARIPAVITSFLNESVGILLRPGNPLYSTINRFFLNGPTFSFADVPLFNQLFLSAGEDFKSLRAWCLRFILRGTQSETDVKLLNRRHVVSQIQSYATSSICDAYSEKLCIAVMLRLVAIPAVLPLLCRNMDVLPWLETVALRTRQSIVRYACFEMIERIAETEFVDLTTLVMVVKKMLAFRDEDEVVEMNKIQLPILRMFAKACRLAQSEAIGENERGLMMEELVACIDMVKKMKKGEAEKVIENCQLSNDDFILLCEPVLKSASVCVEEAMSLMKEMKENCSFILKENHTLEKDLEALLLLSVCLRILRHSKRGVWIEEMRTLFGPHSKSWYSALLFGVSITK